LIRSIWQFDGSAAALIPAIELETTRELLPHTGAVIIPLELRWDSSCLKHRYSLSLIRSIPVAVGSDHREAPLISPERDKGPTDQIILTIKQPVYRRKIHAIQDALNIHAQDIHSLYIITETMAKLS
jgi:hypothetical protein